MVDDHSSRAVPLDIYLLGVMLLSLGIVGFYNYLLFHSVVEMFTIAVAWSVFFLAWNTRRFLDNHYLLLIGIASLFVGALDLLHLLTYKGMGVLPGRTANLPTQFWIAGRYTQGLSFLVAPLFLRRKLDHRLTFGICAAFVLPLIAVLLHGGIFPACYVEGAGLTPFKVASEYAVILMLMASIALLFQNRTAFDPAVFAWLVLSLALSIAAGMAFTMYADVYGVMNMTGHLIRFLSVCFIYRALVVTGLVKPTDLLFRTLAQSEDALRIANGRLEQTLAALRQSDERYRSFVANSSEGIWRIEFDSPIDVSLPVGEQVQQFLERGSVAEANEVSARMRECRLSGGIVGMRVSGLLPGSQRMMDLVSAFVRSGCRVTDAEFDLRAAGVLRWVSGSLSGIVENGFLIRAWGVERDITDSKRVAADREHLIGELQGALAEVRRLSGLLPICANCKKIRDDRGYWHQVETYIKERADVSFTHGICPDCVQALYPELKRNTLPSEPKPAQ